MTEPQSHRRAFLIQTGLASAGVLFAGAAAPAVATPRREARGSAGNGDIDILQTALALEHEGIAAYTIAASSGLLTPDVIAVASAFLDHHRDHRDRLASLVRTAGGSPVEAKTDADYVRDLNLGALRSQGDVLALATRLEMGATSAYVGQVAGLTDRSLATILASIGADEASHWAILNAATGGRPPARGFIFG